MNQKGWKRVEEKMNAGSLINETSFQNSRV